MAQNVVIAGASFSNVPSIRVPDENNVYHPFVDPSPTTATDSDVASGKVYFKADGTQSTGTASGGGGSYPWFGSGAEKLSTGLSRTINLKNDTNYDNWTASTTATTLIAASASPDLSYTANLNNYDYYIVHKGFVQPAHLPGATLKSTTYRVCQYGITYFYGYPSNTATAEMQQGDRYYCGYINPNASAFYIQYYYNNNGVILARSATQCGPIYMSASPTVSCSPSTLSSGETTLTVTLPAFYAKCDSSRFSTTRKGEVDSSNTNYYLTVEIYRVPVGGSWFSKLAEDFYDTINA